MELLSGPPTVRMEGIKGSSKANELVILLEDSIYLIDTNMVDSIGDCFDYQCLGVLSCRTCNCKNSKDCEGGKTKESGVNVLGHNVPIAVKVGDRPKRDWSKVEKEESNTYNIYDNGSFDY